MNVKGMWIGGSGSWGVKTIKFPEIDPRVGKVEALESLETPFGVTAVPNVLWISGEPILHFTMHGWKPDSRFATWERSKQVAWAAKEFGVEWAVVEASVGGISRPDNGELLPPWSVVVTSDFIADYTPPDFPVVVNPANPYPRLLDPLCGGLRRALFVA